LSSVKAKPGRPVLMPHFRCPAALTSFKVEACAVPKDSKVINAIAANLIRLSLMILSIIINLFIVTN
jgi:hypothetical protein